LKIIDGDIIGMNIREKIKQQKEFRKISYYELAKLSDMPYNSLMRYLRSDEYFDKIQFSTLKHLAKALNVPMSFFFDDKNDYISNASLSDTEVKIITKYRDLDESAKLVIRKALGIR